MSTLISSSPRVLKHSATALPSAGTFLSVKMDTSSCMLMPVIGISSTNKFSFIIISLLMMYVPLLLSVSNDLPKNNLTLYFLASSTALVSILSAPRLAISIISSYVIALIGLASGYSSGSTVYRHSEVVYISQSHPRCAAIPTAVISDPPLPRVVISPSSSIPWKPATTATLPLFTISSTFSVFISLILAFV